MEIEADFDCVLTLIYQQQRCDENVTQSHE